MARLNKEREERLEPLRVKYAKEKLEEKGLEVVECGKSLSFVKDGYHVTFYPYSGWFSGKTIKDGRGLENLLKQL